MNALVVAAMTVVSFYQFFHTPRGSSACAGAASSGGSGRNSGASTDSGRDSGASTDSGRNSNGASSNTGS